MDNTTIKKELRSQYRKLIAAVRSKHYEESPALCREIFRNIISLKADIFKNVIEDKPAKVIEYLHIDLDLTNEESVEIMYILSDKDLKKKVREIWYGGNKSLKLSNEIHSQLPIQKEAKQSQNKGRYENALE